MKKMLWKNVWILGASVVAGFLLLLLVHLLPTDKMQENVYWSKDTILAEFEDQLVIDGYESTMTGSFTDCLMLHHAIYKSEEHSALEQSMRMYRSESCPEGGDAWWAGQSLVDYLDGAQQPKEAQYPRYWHGYLVFLKPLLMLTSLNGIRMMNVMGMTVLLGAVLLICGYTKKIGLGVAYLAALPFLYYGTSFASLSLSICFYIAFGSVLGVLLMKKKEYWPLWFLATGIATAYFDFLTYPLVTLCFPLCACLYISESGVKNKWETAFACLLEWGVGYAVMWGSKWILSDLMTGGSTVSDAFATIFTRAGSAEGSGRFGGFVQVVQSNLAPFMNLSFVLFMLAVLVCLIWFLVRRERTWLKTKLQFIAKLQQMSVLLGVAVLPFVWWFVMQNHSQEHWAYTCRNFAIVVLAVVAAVLQPAKE